MKLSILKTNTIGHVINIKISGNIGERLMELGLVNNTEIKVLRAGDPVLINLRGFNLAIRKEYADYIEVEYGNF